MSKIDTSELSGIDSSDEGNNSISDESGAPILLPPQKSLIRWEMVTSVIVAIFLLAITIVSGYSLFWNAYIAKSVVLGDYQAAQGYEIESLTSYVTARVHAAEANHSSTVRLINFEVGNYTFCKYIEVGETYSGSFSAMEHILQYLDEDEIVAPRLVKIKNNAELYAEAYSLIEAVESKVDTKDYNALSKAIDEAAASHPEYPDYVFLLYKLEKSSELNQSNETQLECFYALRDNSPKKLSFYLEYGVRALIRENRLSDALWLCAGDDKNDITFAKMKMLVLRFMGEYKRADGVYDLFKYSQSNNNDLDKEKLIVDILVGDTKEIKRMIEKYSLDEDNPTADLLYTMEVGAIVINDRASYVLIDNHLKSRNIPESEAVSAYASRKLTLQDLFLNVESELF